MLSIVESESEGTLRRLQRRVAATKRACGDGFLRYETELRAEICEFIKAQSLSANRVAALLGVSAPTVYAWLREMSGFRAVTIEESAVAVPAEFPCQERAQVRLGNGVLLEIPITAVDGDFLALLSRL